MIADTQTIGFGTMELCFTTDRPPLTDAKRLLTDLVENHGLKFIDTADAYCLNEDDFGYGEELVTELMRKKDLLVATKGGFTRPGGAWKKRGDPQYIRKACEASLRRLKVESLPLYQFHTPDPEVPFEETLGAFIDLKNEGKVQKLGLSNVSLEQLELATRLTTISSVQNPLSILWYQPQEHEPILHFCEQNDITFLAYGPLGGHRNKGALLQPPEVQSLATRSNMSAFQFGLNALMMLSPAILPIPGSTNCEHILHNMDSVNHAIPREVFEELLAIFAE